MRREERGERREESGERRAESGERRAERGERPPESQHAGLSPRHLVLDIGGYALLGLAVLALLVIKCLTARKGSFKKAIGVQSSMY